MINEYNAKKFCKEDISKIENYDKAVNDTTQMWHCHHRDEIKLLPSGIMVIRSKQDLIENGRYYNCPANELIFLTCAEHIRLHQKGKKLSDQHKEAIRKSVSHPLTEEHKQKIRDTWTEERRKETGEKNLKYWQEHYDEIVQKMREAVENWKKHKDLPSEADNYREYQKLYHRMWYRENRERVLRQRNRRKRR